jgi:hypothetical protein
LRSDEEVSISAANKLAYSPYALLLRPKRGTSIDNEGAYAPRKRTEWVCTKRNVSHFEIGDDKRIYQYLSIERQDFLKVTTVELAAGIVP